MPWVSGNGSPFRVFFALNLLLKINFILSILYWSNAMGQW